MAIKLAVRISAIKPILATFGDFDGVGQLIATKQLIKKRVDIILGGRNLDRLCLGEIFHKN
jgi:hypothetical protein